MSKFIGKKVRLKGSKPDCFLGVGVVLSVDQGLSWSGAPEGGWVRMDRFKIHFLKFSKHNGNKQVVDDVMQDLSRTMCFFIDEVEFIDEIEK